MAYLKTNPIVLPPEINNTASYTVTISSLGLTLVDDEWLLVFISCPVTAGTLSPSGTGWTEVAELDVASGSRIGVYKCKVASGTAADLVITLSTGTGMWHGFIAQVPDANASDCISGSSSTDGGNVASMTPATFTPADNDCLVFYFGASRVGGTDPAIRFLASDVVGEALNDINNSGGTYSAVCLGTRQQGTAADASKVLYGANTVRMGTILVAVKNKASGAKAADCRAGITKLAWMGNFGVANEGLGTTWGEPSTFCSAWPSGNINGVTAGTVAATISNTSAAYWGTKSRMTSTTSTAGAWVGGWIATPVANMDLTGKFLSIEFDMLSIDYLVGTQGVCIALGDSASASTGNAVVYQLSPKQLIKQGTTYTAMIAVETATTIQTVGTINFATINKIGFFYHRIGSSTNARYLDVRNVLVHSNSTMVGGNSSRPLDIKYLDRVLNGWGYLGCCNLQGDAVLVKTSIQFGDGSIATYLDTSGTLLNTPTAYSTITQPFNNITAGAITVGVYASASDTINMISAASSSGAEQNFTVNASSSASAPSSFNGHAFKGWNPTMATNLPVIGAVFSNCGPVAFKGADVTSCTVSNTTATATESACTWDANGAVVTSTTIDVTGSSAGYHIELGASLTSIELTDVTFTGTPATDKIHSLAMSGTVTLNVGGTTTLVAGDVTFPVGSTAVASVVSATAITFAGLVAGMKVKVFTTTTATELFGVTSSGTSEVWAGASGTFDYTIQKAGYVPIRGVGEVVSGSRTITITPEVDRAYVASSGLTLDTNCFVTVGTKLFGLSTTSTLQNFYSYMIEQWVALGDGGEELANVAFPITPNGPNSFTFLNEWEWDLTTYTASITNLSRDGLRYTNTGGTTTAQWCALLTSGVPSGTQVRYQQSDAGTTVDAENTGEVDQLIQIYGDATHGNFDKRGYLVVKAQRDGYDQAESNVVTLYGTLEDQLYVIGFTPLSNGLATGNPSLATAPTISQGTYVYDSKTFSAKIVDGATANSGTMIMRWLRYNFGLGGAFQSEDAFNWHDLVQKNGTTKFKTVNGVVYGTATTKGVLVYMNDGTTLHPDFNLFTADNGTTYEPLVVASVSITGMPDAGGASCRLQIINSTAITSASRANSTAYAVGDVRLRQTGIGSENTAGLYLRCTVAGTSAAAPPAWNTTPGGTTTDGGVTWTTYAVLFYDADPAGTSYSTTYTNGNQFLSGETVEIRFAEMDAGTSFKTYDTTTIVSSEGFSIAVAEEADDVYATNALDGSAYETTYSPNFTLHYVVLDTDTDFAGKSAYAYFCYTLTTSNGMYLFWGGVTALDVGNYRIETDILNLYFDESGGFVKQTDDVRIYRKDGLRPAIDPTTGGYGIEINWRTPVSVVSTGSSALTPTESAYLLALPSAATNATAVVTKAVDGATTLAESLAIQNAVLAGKVTGAGTGTETFRDLADTKNRIVVTTDPDGNRTAVVRDGS